MKLRWNALYFFLAILLLMIEIVIALFVHDELIRPIGGDFLVVVFLSCKVSVKSRCFKQRYLYCCLPILSKYYSIAILSNV